MTPTIIQKLEDAFTNAFSDVQACAYVGISTTTLFHYETANPEFRKRKAMLKLRPDIRAKQTVVHNLGNAFDAWRWLERRDPEFKPTSKLEHAGAIEVLENNVIMSDDEKTALEALRMARRKRIEADAKVINKPKL